MNFIRILAGLITSFLFVSCVVNPKTTEADSRVEKHERSASRDLITSIWAIHQDSDGDYWFGSNGNGVYRYDGEKLTNYTELDGLVDNSIRGIQCDKQGNVYIETPSGVSKFDGQKFTTLEVADKSPNEWRSEPDDLWFSCNATAEDVYRYDGEYLYELQLPRDTVKNKFGVFPNLGDGQTGNNRHAVFGMNRDHSGHIWFGTAEAGAFRFDGEGFLHISEPELLTLEDGRVPGVRSIIQADDGNYWMSNTLYRYKIDENGVYKKISGVEAKKGQPMQEFPYFLSAVIDETGSLWMVTYAEGVWVYDSDNLKKYRIRSGSNEIHLMCIYLDRENILWLGTENDGVYQWDGKAFEKFHPKTK